MERRKQEDYVNKIEVLLISYPVSCCTSRLLMENLFLKHCIHAYYSLLHPIMKFVNKKSLFVERMG